MRLLSIDEQEFQKRLGRIRLLLLDVDGVLTDGTIFHVPGQGWTRSYNIYDGYGIKLLQKAGIPVGIISGGASEELKERIRYLGIRHAVLGSEDKLASLRQLSAETGIPPESICFMGDELFDMPALKEAGLAITVPDAMPEVFGIAHAVTSRAGGRGAVREVIDRIRSAVSGATQG
jgi:3-deoxy-D-manno-octulosonate 8-phosphate phosphatase (KDO 8-P phosphatase)